MCIKKKVLSKITYSFLICILNVTFPFSVVFVLQLFDLNSALLLAVRDGLEPVIWEPEDENYELHFRILLLSFILFEKRTMLT